MDPKGYPGFHAAGSSPLQKEEKDNRSSVRTRLAHFPWGRRVLAFAVLLLTATLTFGYLAPTTFSPSSLMGSVKDDFYQLQSDRGDLYLLGVGKADITGPVVEINMMGYADPKQVGSGLRQRLYSRAFIIGDTKDPESLSLIHI